MLLRYPQFIFVVCLAGLWLAVRFGGWLRKKIGPVSEDTKEDLSLLTGASLTLLALIIGFSFSMAVSRYDQRKNYEEEEANAIGTEYVRADLLPSADAAKVRQLLTQYLDQRLLFYTTYDMHRLAEVGAETTSLQAEMWAVVQSDAKLTPTPTMALVVSGMNDVLNRQGYTQAAWWNRIPIGGWALMWLIALCCCVLTGYGGRSRGPFMIMILPFLISISFFFIADIDSPRRGVIRIVPQNLISLSQSLRAH